MTVNMNLATGINLAVGQRYYFGGQWFKIAAKYPVHDKGQVVSYNIILER